MFQMLICQLMIRKENIKPGFKRTSSWNKYRSKIKTQPNNNETSAVIWEKISEIY